MIRPWLPAALLMASSAAAFAQSVAAPGTPTSGSGQPVISPKNGQSSDQLARDRYECHHWATSQSGYDPSLAGASQSNPSGPAGYQRAFAACMDGRGYDVRYSAPAAAAPAPLPTTPARATTSYVYAPGPELKYRPVEFAVEGGFTAPAGRTGDHYDYGATGGLGLVFFPSPVLPVGIRLDASYSRFDVRHDWSSGGNYTRGHENLYGADADLQFDFLKTDRNKFYLFGGAGEYQEQVRRHQTTFADDTTCGFFNCGPGTADTTAERRTTGWRPSYNAGLGWETAIADHASLFVEARYLRVQPGAQFVPVRVGFRF